MRWDIICQVSNWKSTFLLLSYKPVKTGYNGNAGIGCTTIIQQCITKSQVMGKKTPMCWRECYRKCISCNYNLRGKFFLPYSRAERTLSVAEPMYLCYSEWMPYKKSGLGGSAGSLGGNTTRLGDVHLNYEGYPQLSDISLTTPSIILKK